MGKNNSVYFNQAAIENAFKRSKERGNYFIEFNRSVILEACKNSTDEATPDTLLDRLKEIQEVVNDKSPLSIDQYTLIGSFAYFYGMDFAGQGFLHLNICEFVRERFMRMFDNYDFSDLEITTLYDILLNIREINLVTAKDAMKNAILEEIKLPNSDDMHVLKTIIMPGLKSITNNAIIPINLAKELTDLKVAGTTYQTISKYNLLINQDCNMLGKSIKTYCNIYSQALYNTLLNECLLREEKTKFAVMYLDSIISISEAIQRMELTSKDFVNITINIDALKETFDFENSEKKFNEKFPAKETSEAERVELEKIKSEPYTPKISNEELNEKFVKCPDLVVAAYFEEVAKSNKLTVDSILDIAEKLTESSNDELLQHIYQYISTNQKSAIDPENHYPYIDFAELVSAIDSKITVHQDEYRELVEFICQPIPENQIQRIITYVNDIIGCLVLTDAQQKQYLISQYTENSISTYNQLQQIVSLIEGAKVFGADAITYSTLYCYLNDNDNFTEVFEKAKGMAVLENKISLLTKMKEWFGRYPETETSDTNGKPKMEILK